MSNIKRIVALLLCIAMLTLLCGCDSKALKEAKKSAKAIGEVTVDSGDAITAAESLYAALTDEEKSKFDCYQELLDSRAAYEGKVATAVQSLLDDGDYESALQKVQSLDKTTISNISKGISERLLQVLAWFSMSDFGDMDFEDGMKKAQIASDIAGFLEIPASSEYSELQKHLSAVADFLTKYQGYGDMCGIVGKYDEGITSAEEAIQIAFSNSSKTGLELGTAKLLAEINKISYQGTEEAALNYIDGVTSVYSGFVGVLSGIELRSDSLYKEGLTMAKDGLEVSIECAEKYAEILKEYMTIIAQYMDWKCLDGVKISL